MDEYILLMFPYTKCRLYRDVLCEHQRRLTVTDCPVAVPAQVNLLYLLKYCEIKYYFLLQLLDKPVEELVLSGGKRFLLRLDSLELILLTDIYLSQTMFS